MTMYYQSVTSWGFDWRELPGWEIAVLSGSFSSIKEAAKFGNSVSRLFHILGQDYFILHTREGTAYIISRSDITVWKQKTETFGKFMIEPTEDLEEVKLDSAEITELPETFYSLSYGVADENGRKVEFKI